MKTNVSQNKNMASIHTLNPGSFVDETKKNRVQYKHSFDHLIDSHDI